MLLAGPGSDKSAGADLHSALQDFANGSSLFDTAVAVSADSGLPSHVGQFEPAAATLLGVEGITLLAMRPDGYVGLRSDQDHLAALKRYSTLVQAGTA
jgi:hypothetical protein